MLLTSCLRSCLTLERYLKLLVYDWKIFESSSVVLTNLQFPWEIFGNFREMSGRRSCGCWTTFGESADIIAKWSEIFGKSSKTSSSVCLYIFYFNSDTFMDFIPKIGTLSLPVKKAKSRNKQLQLYQFIFVSQKFLINSFKSITS